ncbi:MAG: hypothetical protein JXB19_12370 [Bacteroidales bacterium]|nr:hypothetical protein [Bacteroidales bacterium]
MTTTGGRKTLMKSIILSATLVFCSTLMAAGQDASQMIRYTPDFKFKDGLFLRFEQVQQNSPIPISLIISPVPYDDQDFYERILQDKVVQYFDQLGIVQEIQIKDLWGYSHNGMLHVNINDGFYRITVIGKICHFVASLTTYNNYYNPYYPYTSPYYYPYYNPYSYYPDRRTTEMRQYLLDFTTGNIMDYDVPEIEVLLMADPELHDEYTSLSKRKRRQSKFLYIRKFNDRNPLYFPAN